MRLASLKQIKNAAINICNEETWNNTDANFLLNQELLLRERLLDLHSPATTSISVWNNYDAKHTALCKKIDICKNPHLAKVA